MTNPIKRPALMIFFLVVTSGTWASEPKQLSYNKPVKLTGTIIREFDMHFVDDSLSPLRDPKEVARAVAKARSGRPADQSKSHDPVAHLILRLDQPASMEGKSEANINEIDLGGAADAVKEKELGKTRFVVSGTLWPASTVHHLRPVMMVRAAFERAK